MNQDSRSFLLASNLTAHIGSQSCLGVCCSQVQLFKDQSDQSRFTIVLKIVSIFRSQNRKGCTNWKLMWVCQALRRMILVLTWTSSPLHMKTERFYSKKNHFNKVWKRKFCSCSLTTNFSFVVWEIEAKIRPNWISLSVSFCFFWLFLFYSVGYVLDSVCWGRGLREYLTLSLPCFSVQIKHKICKNMNSVQQQCEHHH